MRIRANSWVLGGATLLLLLASAGLYWPPALRMAMAVLAVLGVAVVANLLLFHKKVFALLVMVAIPFSQEMEITASGSTLSLPSEAMISLFSIVMMIYLVGMGGTRAVLTHPLTILIIIDTVWLVVTSLTSTDVGVSLKRVMMRGSFLIFGYFFMFHWFKDPKALLKPVLFYTLGIAVVIVVIIKAHAFYDFAPQVAFVIPEPYYDEHTVYAACIAFVLVPLFYVCYRSELISRDISVKILLYSVLALVLFGFVLTYSRAGWLSIVVGTGLYLLLRWKVKPRSYVIGFLSVALLALIFHSAIYEKIRRNDSVSNDGNVTNHITSVTNVSSDASNLERINRWVCAWRMFKARPLLGFGPGTYQFEYAQYQSSDYTTYISTVKGDRGNAHSEYLMYLSESGIIGFSSFLLIVCYTLYLGIRNNLRTEGYVREINNVLLIALTTFFFHGVFNSFIDQEKMAILVFSSMAGVAAIDRFHRRV